MSEVKPGGTTEFAAWIGLDWSDKKHDLALLAAGAKQTEASTVEQTPEAIDTWVAGLRQRFGGRRVAICLEQTRAAIVIALLKYDFLTIYPVAPSKLASYREAFNSSGAKDDPTDAEFLLDYLLRHGDQLRAWRPDTPQTREMQILAEDRRDAVHERTRCTNQLLATLKGYFPQAVTLVGDDLATPLACDFLGKWPTLQAVQARRGADLRKFYYAHHCRQEELLQQRLELVKSALPLTEDSAIIQPSILKMQRLIAQLRNLAKSIAQYDERIQELLQQHPDGALFSSLPGAAAAPAPRLLAAFGTDRERFGSAAEVQSFSGIAPVTKRSGKRSTVHRRYACSAFLRQTFHEFAGHSRLHSPWAKAFYDHQRAAGHAHHTAVRALAFKWIRILYRCWKTSTAYSETIYLDALQAAKAPLLKFLPASGA